MLLFCLLNWFRKVCWIYYVFILWFPLSFFTIFIKNLIVSDLLTQIFFLACNLKTLTSRFVGFPVWLLMVSRTIPNLLASTTKLICQICAHIRVAKFLCQWIIYQLFKRSLKRFDMFNKTGKKIFMPKHKIIFQIGPHFAISKHVSKGFIFALIKLRPIFRH